MNEKAPQTIYVQLVKNNRFLKIIIFVLLLLLVFAMKNNMKPPIVIRYLPEKAEYLTDYESGTKIIKEDIEIFLDHFIRNLNLLDSYTLEDNLPRALNMMHPDLRGYYKQSVLSSQLLQDVVNTQTKTTTRVVESEFDSKETVIPATVVYERNLIRFENQESSRLLVRAELILEKTPRSKKYPYGLRVQKYKEIKLN